MALSYARHSEMLRSVPANAQKVYDIVPIADGWTYSQLHQEIQRRGINMDKDVVMGCVCRLKDAGLVYEPSQSKFQRVAYKSKPELRIPTKEIDMASATIPTLTAVVTKADPKALSVTDKVAQITSKMRSLADELDDLALVVEERLHGEDEELKKLRMLQAAIKALG